MECGKERTMKRKIFLGVMLTGLLFGMSGCGAKVDYSALDKIVNGTKDEVVSGVTEGEKKPEVYSRHNISKATVGDRVVFGSYEQDNNERNGKEQIEWVVLDEKDGKKLLISRYILDSRYYSKEAFQKWESSSLRSWLNKDFYEEAFSEKEKKYIAATALNNPDNKYYEELVKPYVTTDVIFLLGAEEAEAYKNATATAGIMTEGVISTAYARANGLQLLKMGEQTESYWCFLRSCGYHDAYAALISTNGTIDRGGISISEEGIGVRPVLWMCEEEQAKAPSYIPVAKKEEVSDDNSGDNTQGNTENNEREEETGDNQGSSPTPEVTKAPVTQKPKATKAPSEQEAKPTKTPAVEKEEESFKYVTFGSYEQDNNPDNGKEAIEWLVLEEKGGKALLVSRYILDANHVEEFYDIWEERPIRTWLNEEFYNAAFSKQEKKSVIESKIANPDNDGYDVKASETKERVFLLSVNEVERYFGENDSVYGNSRLATSATAYAVAQGVRVMEYGGIGDGNSDWDLRSNGYHEGYAAWVNDCGQTYAGGHAQAENRGIRPAIYIDAAELED